MGTIESRTLHALVDAAIDGLPPGTQAAPRSIVEIGSAHTVVLLDGAAAVRIGRDPGTAAAMRKRQQLVDSIPESQAVTRANTWLRERL
ncbi:hypothetical protein NNX39_13350 [Arthrobacter sp. zg-Y826]|uniref:hypothetical protein n=1 Tax=Arthrobacter jinronghuae TaxID=2964609 RepID=UPI00210226D1|nr:hypothetical protein [Arthrobacter jinronghuae]MCQ1957482.1 hypothetical protein [Arthrobacter jinronghuae]